jgi:hypothetical protein
MKTEFLSFLGSIMVFSAVAVVPAFSQSWPAGITPVRGVVVSVSGDVLTVNSQSGLVKIHLGSPLKVYRTTPSDLAHVNSKSFVGVTSVKQPDGSERATKINIFPDELRGIGEGSYLMNPDPAKSASSSRMTNGTVSGVGMAKDNGPPSRMTNGTVSTKSGASTLSVQYSGGVETISVPRDVSVTALTPTADKLKQGEDVFVVAKTQRDGSYITTNIISISAGTAK